MAFSHIKDTLLLVWCSWTPATIDVTACNELFERATIFRLYPSAAILILLSVGHICIYRTGNGVFARWQQHQEYGIAMGNVEQESLALLVRRLCPGVVIQSVGDTNDVRIRNGKDTGCDMKDDAKLSPGLGNVLCFLMFSFCTYPLGCHCRHISQDIE